MDHFENETDAKRFATTFFGSTGSIEELADVLKEKEENVKKHKEWEEKEKERHEKKE